MTRGMNNLQANLCLLAVTLCWSCEVIIFSVIPADINPFATTCITAIIGAAILGACFFRRIVDAFKQDGKLLAKRIVILAVMNTTYNVLNLVGLNYFDVSTGAFTMSMTVVILPVMLLVMRRGVGVKTWISAGCVLVGIIVAVSSTIQLPQLTGLIVMGVSCVIRALYIVKLNDYAHEHDPITLAMGISAVNAVIAFVPWCVMQPNTFAAIPWSTEVIAAYFVYAYFIVGFATVLNIFAQRRATATQSTIIYSTEIVFSTIWAVCLPAEVVDPVTITIPIVVGCTFIVAGNLVEIIPFGFPEEDSSEPTALEATVQAASTLAQKAQAAANTARRELLASIKNPLASKFALFGILVVVYLVLALPFSVLSVIPGFTEIRPVELLQPVYGIFFGLPGCFAFATGNLIGDIMSDSLKWSSIAGFIGSFAYPYLMYLFWTKIRKDGFNLRQGATLALFVLSIVVCAAIQAAIITPAVAIFYPDVDTFVFARSVFSNGALFPIGFAVPLIILMQEELGFAPVGA